MADKPEAPNSASELFRQAVGNVQPIQNPRRHTPTSKPAPRPRQQEKDNREIMDNLLSHDEYPLDVRPDEYLEYRGNGVQYKTMRKLKRGEYRRDGEIDLHGMNAVTARRELTTFLHHARNRGWRCVHIIHGKGYRSSNGEPVLKSRINNWLRQYRGIIAFCSATPRDGGTGAVYVLLKNK